jgi:hypothetical protein
VGLPPRSRVGRRCKDEEEVAWTTPGRRVVCGDEDLDSDPEAEPGDEDRVFLRVSVGVRETFVGVCRSRSIELRGIGRAVWSVEVDASG